MGSSIDGSLCSALYFNAGISSGQLSLSPCLRAFFIIIIWERRNPLRWLQQQPQQQQLSAALQPCSSSPEHWPTGDNISKGVVIATHYIIIISDPSPFTPTAEQSHSTINLNYGKCFGGCFPAPVCSLTSPWVCVERQERNWCSFWDWSGNLLHCSLCLHEYGFIGFQWEEMDV